MKRQIAVALILGLLVGAGALPAEAKKKKKKPPVVTLVPAEAKYFLHWETDGTATGCGEVYMSLTDSTGDSTCSTTTQAAQEVLMAAGEDPITTVFIARDGVPVTLDASRKLTGEIVLRGTVSVDAYVEVLLTGTVGGAEVEIATGETESGDGAASNSVQGTPLPGPAVVLPIEFDMNAAVDKLQASALTLTVTIRGVHRGGIDYERNPSHIIIPTFQ